VELRRQLSFLRASFPLIATCTAVGLVVALVVSLLLSPTYAATVRLSVGQTTNGTASGFDAYQVSQKIAQTYAEQATTNLVANNVIAALGLQTTSEDLLKHVKSEAQIESTLLTITVDDHDPAEAVRIADAFAAEVLKGPAAGSEDFAETKAYIAEQLQKTRAQIDAAQVDIDRLAAINSPTEAQQAQLDDLENRIATLRGTFASLVQLAAGSPANQVTIFDPAYAPKEPVSPRVLLNTLLGAVLGMVVGVLIAYTRRRLDDTLRTPEDVELLTGLSSLGAIVRMPGDSKRPLFYRLATLLYPRSPAAEGFRQIRTSIDFATGDTPPRSLLITSASPGDGKTTFASNLAIAYARAGRKVVLVDGDLRKPELHAMFRMPNEVGLADLLSGRDIPFETVAQTTEVAGLRVLPSGIRPANPAELISGGGMPAILASLLTKADLIVIDSPPLQAVTDGAILASQTDGTVLVVASGRTRRAALLRARDNLQHVGARILGTALNGVSESDGKEAALGYFTYYGDSETPSDGAASSGSSARGQAAKPKPATQAQAVRVDPAGTDR
jgi:capsular exopolysaccharide synthesis family protein